MNARAILQSISSLPPEAQQKVMDFIASMRKRHPSPGSRREAHQADIADEPFFGMWRNRADMRDASVWVRDLRKGEWERRRA